MNPGLEQVRAAMAAALEKAGVRAATAFPGGWAKAYDEPVAAVGLRTGESRGGALGSYLGTRLDPTDQTCREVYGMQLDLTLSLDIYAPARMGAAGCDGALETLHQVVLQGLPSGLYDHFVSAKILFFFLLTKSRGSYFTASLSQCVTNQK